MVESFGIRLLELMDDKVDMIFCNQDEALSLAKAETLTDAFTKLKKLSCAFVVTAGSQGAHYFDGRNIFFSKAKRVKAIDTNGAGDMFAGAFLYAINSGCSFKSAVYLANTCAAEVVSNFGPRLQSPKLHQIKRQCEV